MPGKIHVLIGVFFITHGLGLPLTHADEKPPSLIFQTRTPFQITGQLAPFRFLVDGRLLFERPRSYTEIKVNGIKVKLQDQKDRLFSFEVDQDAIAIVASTWNGAKDQFKVKAGKVKEAKWDGEQFLFKIEGNVERATIDGFEASLSEEKIEWPGKKNALDRHKLILVGEGKIPDSTIEFQLVNSADFKKLTAKKKAADRKNPNRLLASQKESWLDKVAWGYAEFDLGLRFGSASGFGLSAAITPKYPYSKTFGLKGFGGLAAFSTPSGFAFGPKIGLHLTYELGMAPVTLEFGPMVYGLSQGPGFAASVDLAGAYDLAGRVPFVNAVGLGYSFWITPSAHLLRLFAEFKF